jgi:hypothetical protein
MPEPSSILLLHGLGGSGEGSVKLLEKGFRELGWTRATILRPTLTAVNRADLDLSDEQRFMRALQELEVFLGERIPHMVLGFSFGGLLAAFAPSRVRLSVCSPWQLLPSSAIHKAADRQEGWSALQGARDPIVLAEPALMALPSGVHQTLDPDGTHAFDDWMDRIATWAMDRWRLS